MLLDQFRYIFWRYKLIKDSLGLDQHNRALRAETLTTGGNNPDLVLQFTLLELGIQRIDHIESLIRYATGSRTDHQMHPILINSRSGALSDLIKFLGLKLHRQLLQI